MTISDECAKKYIFITNVRISTKYIAYEAKFNKLGDKT